MFSFSHPAAGKETWQRTNAKQGEYNEQGKSEKRNSSHIPANSYRAVQGEETKLA